MPSGALSTLIACLPTLLWNLDLILRTAATRFLHTHARVTQEEAEEACRRVGVRPTSMQSEQPTPPASAQLAQQAPPSTPLSITSECPATPVDPGSPKKPATARAAGEDPSDVSRDALLKRLRRMCKVKASGKSDAPAGLLDELNDTVGGGRDRVLDLFRDCGLDKA